MVRILVSARLMSPIETGRWRGEGTVLPETCLHLPRARNMFTYDIPKVPGPTEAKRYKKRNMEKGEKEMNTSNGKD